MKKAIRESESNGIPFCAKTLDELQSKGYKYVQVKGFTIDKHFDYVDPSILVLVPIKELPTDPLKKEIYEPLGSELLYKWASEINEFPQIVIARNY